MDRKATGIVSYITIIGWVIAFCAGDREGAKFHLNQSLVLILAGLIVSALRFIPFIGGLLAWPLHIVLFIFWIIGFVYACQDREQDIPLLGSIKILN